MSCLLSTYLLSYVSYTYLLVLYQLSDFGDEEIIFSFVGACVDY